MQINAWDLELAASLDQNAIQESFRWNKKKKMQNKSSSISLLKSWNRIEHIEYTFFTLGPQTVQCLHRWTMNVYGVRRTNIMHSKWFRANSLVFAIEAKGKIHQIRTIAICHLLFFNGIHLFCMCDDGKRQVIYNFTIRTCTK